MLFTGIFTTNMAKYQLVLETVGNADLETIPVARSGHRCVTDGVFLYSFGGFNPNTVSKLFYKKIWCFHLSTRRWYNVWTESYGFGSVPTCVASSVMILHKGRFIVFGGSGYPFGTHNSDKMFQCDPKEQRWMVLNVTTEVGKPTPGYGQGVVIGQEEYLYIFGGTRGLVYNNNLHKFDFKSCTWELISCQSPPSGRYRHEMVSIDNGFVVIGGYGSSGACPLDKLPVYNYDAHTWNEVQCQPDEDNGFPKPRRAHSCVIFEDNVYVCGGFEEDNSSDKIFNDIWKLNVRTFLWSRIPQELPHPTYFHSAAVTREGCMYIFGGIERIDENQDERTNNVLKMWLVIPPLEKLCWESLCNTIPKDSRLDTKRLGTLGVPKYLLTSYDAQFLVGLQNDDLK